MKNVFKVLSRPKARPIVLNEFEEAAMYKFLQYDGRNQDYTRGEVEEFANSMSRIKGLLKEKFINVDG